MHKASQSVREIEEKPAKATSAPKKLMLGNTDQVKVGCPLEVVNVVMSGTTSVKGRISKKRSTNIGAGRK